MIVNTPNAVMQEMLPHVPQIVKHYNQSKKNRRHQQHSDPLLDGQKSTNSVARDIDLSVQCALALDEMNYQCQMQHVHSTFAAGEREGMNKAQVVARLQQNADKFKRNSLKDRLEDFFNIYNPSMLTKVDTLVATIFHEKSPTTESELVEKLINLYQPTEEHAKALRVQKLNAAALKEKIASKKNLKN